MNIYKEALAVQDTCNISGVIHALDRAIQFVWLEAREKNLGTDYVNNHPVVRLFLEQMVHLNGGVYTETDRPNHYNYTEAYRVCKEKAQ